MRRILFALARRPLLAGLVGRVFAQASFLLPVRRLRETPRLLAFRHPRPCYPVHILIVPKKALRNLAALTPADGPLLAEMLAVAAELAGSLGLSGWQVVANGGGYQDVPQLHFHLISGAAFE